MSLYNMLFGKNAMTDILLAVIGFKENDVERFRNVFASEDGTKIEIYARTGGGNRGDYPQEKLYANPLFVTTCDDGFDSTYATFTFKTPPEFCQDVKNLGDIFSHGIRAEFARHIAVTMNREPTADDIEAREYSAASDAVRRLNGTLANGHTFVPFCDYGMEGALKLAEENGGDLLSAWGILPLKITHEVDKVDRITPRDSSAYERWTRAKFYPSYKWEIDEPYWEHCQKRFGKIYPLAMAKIAQNVARHRDKAP